MVVLRCYSGMVVGGYICGGVVVLKGYCSIVVVMLMWLLL